MPHDEKMRSLKYYRVQEERYHRPEETDLAHVEQRFGHRFPEFYRSFVKEYGCTAFEKGAALASEGVLANDEVEVFFGVSNGHDYDLSEILDQYEGRLPEGLLPIAQDAFGNLICLAVSGAQVGKVFFWNHEREQFPEPGHEPSWQNVTLVADNFDGFIDALTLSPT